MNNGRALSATFKLIKKNKFTERLGTKYRGWTAGREHVDGALKSKGFEFFLPNDSFPVWKIKALHRLLVSSSPPPPRSLHLHPVWYTFTESQSGIVSDGIRWPLISNMIRNQLKLYISEQIPCSGSSDNQWGYTNIDDFSNQLWYKFSQFMSHRGPKYNNNIKTTIHGIINNRFVS